MAEWLRKRARGVKREEKKKVREVIRKAGAEALKKKICEFRAQLRGLKEGTSEYEIFVIDCLEE